MKAELKQIFGDLNAAVSLQRPEAVDVALDGLLRLPGVPGNDRLSDSFIAQVILPVGDVLSVLPAAVLRPLTVHSLAAGRAIGGSALAYRFVKETDTASSDLCRPGSDPRLDVRLSLARTLKEVSKVKPGKVFELGRNWLSDPSSRLRQTALIFFPALADTHAIPVFKVLNSLGDEEDHGVRGALVQALLALGTMGRARSVLELLSSWSDHPQPNDWVICRTLSAPWAVEYPREVLAILKGLESRGAESQTIAAALKALKRHGLEINLESDLNSGEENETECQKPS